MFDLFSFYRSSEWRKLLATLKQERINDEGQIICEYCGKPIVKAYDMIGHHKESLTEENVNDFDISLNPENIQLVHHKCHNMIHNKFGYKLKQIYIVYGAPLAGKHEWVNNNKDKGDLILDIDSIWQCVSGCERYNKPKRLNAVIFAIRDCVLDCVRYRRGKWNNAYIIGGYPLQSERQRLCKELGAREVFIEADINTCKQRLNEIDAIEDKAEFESFIDEWFERYMPPDALQKGC